MAQPVLDDLLWTPLSRREISRKCNLSSLTCKIPWLKAGLTCLIPKHRSDRKPKLVIQLRLKHTKALICLALVRSQWCLNNSEPHRFSLSDFTNHRPTCSNACWTSSHHESWVFTYLLSPWAFKIWIYHLHCSTATNNLTITIAPSPWSSTSPPSQLWLYEEYEGRFKAGMTAKFQGSKSSQVANIWGRRRKSLSAATNIDTG